MATAALAEPRRGRPPEPRGFTTHPPSQPVEAPATEVRRHRASVLERSRHSAASRRQHPGWSSARQILFAPRSPTSEAGRGGASASRPGSICMGRFPPFPRLERPRALSLNPLSRRSHQWTTLQACQSVAPVSLRVPCKLPSASSEPARQPIPLVDLVSRENTRASLSQLPKSRSRPRMSSPVPDINKCLPLTEAIPLPRRYSTC